MRTPYCEVTLRIVRASDRGTPDRVSSERLFSELAFELRNHNAEVSRALHEVHRALRGFGPVVGSPRRLEPPSQRDQLERELRAASRSGQLEIAEIARPKTTVSKRTAIPDRPTLRPEPEQVDEAGHFEVRFVDETGQAIDGIDVVFSSKGRKDTKKTDGNGVARFEGIGSFASVGPASIDALRTKLEPRWHIFRPQKLLEGPAVTQVLFDDFFDAVTIENETPHTVVIRPEFGKIHLELLDKTGRVHHANRDYSISGPLNLAGTTDDNGQLLHEDVPPGDYKLTLTVDDDHYISPVDVLDETEGEPQIRFIGVIPRAVFARLKGLFFETNKSFLLPVVVKQFKHVRELYAENNPSKLLIVGHTDTTAQAAINDPLSLERADCTAAYLLDDVDAWLKMYGTGTPAARRWGSHEDLLMIEAMPDFGTKAASEDSVRWYQRTRSLTVDGAAGTETRTQLVTEYMALDGAPLKSDPNFDVEITTHGCGENFPLDATGDELDAAPVDQSDDASDRRVELFFFDAEFGIQPAPPGKNSAKGSAQYPQWRKKAELAHDLESDHVEGLVLEWSDDLDEGMPDDVLITASQDGVDQTINWADGSVDENYRRFVFTSIGGNDAVTVTAASSSLAVSLKLWDQQVLNDPDNPPTWTHWLEEMVSASDPDGSVDATEDVPGFSDAANAPGDLEGDMFA